MDSSEATKVVYSRIQSLDPENASKIMGYIFIQDPGDKEMIRLAFGPETLLLSLINQAKTHLGISSNTSSTPQSSPRVIIPNNGFHLSPSSPSSPWSVSGFSDHRSPSAGRPASYAAVVNGGASGSFSPPSGSSFLPPPPFLSNSNFSDDYNLQVPDQLSFIEDSSSKNGDFNFIDPIMSPSGRSDSILFPYGNNSAGNCVDSGNCSQNYQQHNLHRRSFSVNDVYLGAAGSEEGFGWRPCMYFARGFCKNGSSCKFLHGGFGDLSDSSATIVGSPGKLDGFDELLRMKAIQQQRLATASQLMTGGSFPYSKGMNFMSDSPRSTGAALMMSEEFHKFGRCRPERSDFSAMGFGAVDSSSRQIYLTFPADSTFKEEDVSNYFSKFGPVQDVRIPYQQKRMFGFVTFVFPETVKMILAKGNPHFVCDSRVLVKPYKEKGKVPEKRQQPHQFERGEFSACPNPTGLDSRESYDFPVGTRMLFNNQEMLRRKLEQAELQQALELQGRRLMNLQLMDLKNHHHNHHAHQFQLAISSPVQPQLQTNHSFFLRSDNSNHIVSEENSVSAIADSATAYEQQDELQEVKEACDNCNANANGNIKEQLVDLKNDDLHESLEHILPDNLFASPTKSAGDHGSIFSSARSEADYSSSVAAATSSTIISVLPAQSSLNMPSLKSCYLQMPRFSSGQEAVEM